MKKLLLAVTVLALVARCAVALAQPVQQLAFQLTHVKSDGQFSFQFTLRTFDTTGLVPPTPTSYFVRLPLGAGVRTQFLTAPYLCNGRALRDALDAHLSGTPFTQRVANLKPFIRSLAKSASKADRAALANARTCQRASLGGGTAEIDGRNVSPELSDLIPVRFSVFLSRATIPGATAAFAILGAAEENTGIVRRFPVLAGVHAALNANLVNDPTPDGLYGYKLLVPTGPIDGLDVSIAEVNGKVHGLTIPKGTCLKQSRRGRCSARQKADLFSFSFPKCPPSGHLSAQLFAGYALPTPSTTMSLQFPCPDFTP